MKLRFLAVALEIAATGIVGCGKKTSETNGYATRATPVEQTQLAAAETQISPAEAQSAAPAAPGRSRAQQARQEAQPLATPPVQEQKEEEQKDNTQKPLG